MENLKIRVNNEAESKEAQELFFGLGYKDRKNWTQRNPIHESIQAWADGEFTFSLNHNQVPVGFKEITLPELRDLVVLKRNDVGDATHENIVTGSKALQLGSENYYWQDEKWNLYPCGVDLKPIEKPMKEYLNKETHEFVRSHSELNDMWIEIPKGSNCYAVNNGYHMFFTDISLSPEWSVLWSRQTHPEELPFIDDECYTNKSDGGFRLPKDEPCDMSKWVELRGVSLNDKYAEIEKVRQSHRTASEIADSALKHIRERAETYDQPTGERSAAKTAKAFNAITGKDITESEVWLLLQLLKDVRQWSREDYHQDSAEDCIAYASLKAESLESEK